MTLDNETKTNPKHQWEMIHQPYTQESNMDKVLEFPEIKDEELKKADVGGYLARCNFKDDDECAAFVEFAYLCIDNKDYYHLRMTLARAQSKIGIKALGLTSRKEMGTMLLTPSLTRDQLGIKAPKGSKDEIYRGSDINERDTDNNKPKEKAEV